MQIEKISTKKLKLNKKNPRTITSEKFQKLKKSIQDFPEMLELRPIVVEDDLTVLGGNMRLKALQALEIKETFIVRASNLTEEQKKEFIAKDNIGFGEWDWDLMGELFELEQLQDWGLDVPDFVLGEEEKEVVEDEYEIPDEIKTDIKLGDLFQVGEHRLLCGDCTKEEEVSLLMDSKEADMVLTDPPYNVDYEGKTKEKLKILNDKMSNEQFYEFLLSAFKAMAEFSKAGASYYIWHVDYEAENFCKAFREAGLHLHQCVIWVKDSMVLSRKDYHYKHEPCLYGWKKGTAHSWYNDRKQTTLLEFDRPTQNKEHPTMKPIPLLAYQIQNNSKEGDIILDSFLGSGSTMVASHQLKRRCYGIELDPKYCQVIIDRMKALDPAIEIIKLNG